MNRVFLTALLASLSVGVAAPAMADDFDDAVASQIKSFVSYPVAAIADDAEGSVGVSLNIDAKGHVAHYHLDGTSGSRSLDRATLRAVRRWAASYATAPGDAHDIHIVVTYQLT